MLYSTGPSGTETINFPEAFTVSVTSMFAVATSIPTPGSNITMSIGQPTSTPMGTMTVNSSNSGTVPFSWLAVGIQLRTLRAAALLAVLALPAHAQSPFSYTNRAGSGPTQAGDPIKLNEATAAGAGKVDQRGGALADPDGNTVVRLGNAGTNPTWYPRTGSRQYGGTVVESSPWGFGNQAGTLGIYTNQTQQQTDYGCSAGGFGENMENRGYAGLSDTVSICHLVNSLVPLATLHHGADFALTNDPSTAVPQYYTLAEGGVHNLTGIPSQDTQINFASPLAPSVVAALKPNMFVRTSTGWTGFVTTWDRCITIGCPRIARHLRQVG